MRHIQTSIRIAASPDRVWQVLTDFPAHARWNPFIRSIGGEPRAGKTLDIRIAPPGANAMRFRPRVLAATPARELRWKGRLLVPGLFDGEHYFLIEPEGEASRLTHGERFSGVLVALMAHKAFAGIEEGFEAMNAALKREAERVA